MVHLGMHVRFCKFQMWVYDIEFGFQIEFLVIRDLIVHFQFDRNKSSKDRVEYQQA